MLTNGTVLHGRYRIVREIGHGGMGAVYEAIDSRLQNTIAVKECRLPGIDADRAFEREAKLLAALRHPALPVVIDYFVEGNAQFLVMQFIEGDDLGKLLDHRRSRFPPAEVVVWARTVLDALCYLHDQEPPVVHRDIKPANLKRTPRGEIVLLDFGLAKGRPEDAATPPADRSVFGYTLAYAPLEQILGRKTDTRGDVYAVGATLYHLLTGYPPANARDRSRAVASGTPDPLPAAHQVGADIPENLGRLIARAMALDGADRYASARAMRVALNDCGVNQTTHVDTPDHQGASRRIDVAAPSRAEVGRQIDLLVQVRFATSTRLGLEDWPSKARPTEIEQVSEALQLAYPTDPQTGGLLPARLRIKLVAPDFRVDSQADRLIEVPPDDVLEAAGVPADAIASRFLSYQRRSLRPRRSVSRSRPGRDRGGRRRRLRAGDLRRQPGARSRGSPGGGASAGRAPRCSDITGFTRGRYRLGSDDNAQSLGAES